MSELIEVDRLELVPKDLSDLFLGKSDELKREV